MQEIDAATGHCICHATDSEDVVPRCLAIALRAQVAELTRERDDKYALAQNYSERLKEAQQINVSLHESGRNHHKYCATLTRELAQLRVDKERLEHVILHGLPQLYDNAIGEAHPSMRFAIDAAMSARNEKEAE